MPDRDIIVIGASADGVETLIQLCKILPANLPAALCIVMHLSSTTRSVLPEFLSRAGELPAVHLKDGDLIRPGTIYVAPPDYHMEISNNHVHLMHGPFENGYRPSIDVMFRTAAEAYGPRVIGIVLSGMLSDGTLGLQAIHEAGGFAIVQDTEDGLFPSMPQSALQNVRVDAVLPLPRIAREIIDEMSRPARQDLKAFWHGKDTSPRTRITCPACGVLSEIRGDILLAEQVGNALDG